MGEWQSFEAQFVVQGVGASIRGGELAVDDVEQSIDWETVFEYATRHSVGPVLFETLRESPAVSVPEPVFERLRSRSHHVAQRNLRLLQEVGSLSETFRDAGIRAIPYRGPVIAELAYGDVSRRTFGDLDLLVDREAIPEIKSLLQAQGYEPAYVREGTEELTPSQEWAYRRVEREYSFEHAREPLEVELHWRVLSRHFPTAFELETVWDRRRSLSVAGTSVPVLSPEDRLLLCCVHGSRHRWERLHWSGDVAAYLSDHEFDWGAVVRRARDHDCERMLLLGLATARDLFDAAVPRWIQTLIDDDPAIDPLLAHVCDRLFDDTIYWQLDERRYQSRTLDRRRDRATFWATWLFKPNRTDVEAISLPRSLSPLYRLVRPTRLAWGTISRLRPGSEPATERGWN